MYITKSSLYFCGMILSMTSYAHNGIDHSTDKQQVQLPSHQHSIMQDNAQSTLLFYSKNSHQHMDEHGGQIYNATRLKTQWVDAEKHAAQWQNKLDTWIGTDENKIALELNSKKAEHDSMQWDAALLYRRAISTYWDIQAGVKYQDSIGDETTRALFGIHGVAPYFFETDVNLYLSDQQISLSAEGTRDFLFTQKLIAQPYVELEWIFYQHNEDNMKLSELSAGVELRYEINRNIMPFIDVAYSYDTSFRNQKGIIQSSEQGGVWGAGIRFLF